jgi:hypothetical protein
MGYSPHEEHRIGQTEKENKTEEVHIVQKYRLEAWFPSLAAEYPWGRGRDEIGDCYAQGEVRIASNLLTYKSPLVFIPV